MNAELTHKAEALLLDACAIVRAEMDRDGTSRSTIRALERVEDKLILRAIAMRREHDKIAKLNTK